MHSIVVWTTLLFFSRLPSFFFDIRRSLSPAFTDVDHEGAEAVDTVATTPTPTLELGGGGPKEGFAFGSDMKGHQRSISQHSIDRFSLQRSTDDDVSGAESDSSSSFADEVRGLTMCVWCVRARCWLLFVLDCMLILSMMLVLRLDSPSAPHSSSFNARFLFFSFFVLLFSFHLQLYADVVVGPLCPVV